MASPDPMASDSVFSGSVLRSLAQGWLPGLAWFDGAHLSRSFVGAEPDLVIEGDSLAQIDEIDRRWRADRSRVWMGWLTYELGVDHLLQRAPGRGPRPGLCLRRFPAAIERHPDGRELAHGDDAAVGRLQAALRRASSAQLREPPWPLEPLRARLDAEDYRDRVRRARESIAAGETYQVNLSQSFGARWKASAPPGTPVRVASTYAGMRRRWPASMGAVFEADSDTWFLSNSPETLLDVRLGSEPGADLLARSWPIKGTRPRHADPTLDAEARQQLWDSDKDRAEHLMIVDLVRNDLGRIAQPGTVQSHPEPEPLTLPTVHHLVTEVRARLSPETSLRQMVEAVFPGGSITGAPKRRTVEIIDELEEHARGIYCGAMVLLEPQGVRMSIPIRTAVVDRYGMNLCAGGGIVFDSEPEAERLETIAKTLAFCGPG